MPHVLSIDFGSTWSAESAHRRFTCPAVNLTVGDKNRSFCFIQFATNHHQGQEQNRLRYALDWPRCIF
jgi:hypothetical protein